MGEAAPFIKHSYDSVTDVQIALAGLPSEIARASELASSAIARLTQAALAGDKDGMGAANEEIGQTIGALNDLAIDHAKALAWAPSPALAKQAK
jgi:hypothetical protein